MATASCCSLLKAPFHSYLSRVGAAEKPQRPRFFRKPLFSVLTALKKNILISFQEA
jgi:hypothetical protein